MTRFLNSTRTEIRPRCVTPFTCKQTTLLPFLFFFALQSCCNSSPGAKARAPNQLKIQYLSTLRQNDTGPLTAPSVKTCLKPTMNQCDETSAHWSLGHGKHIDTHVAKWRNMENCAHCSPRICAKGYRHEWWSLGEFHNTRLKQVKSGSHNRAADPQWTPVYPLDQGNSQPQTKSLSYRFIFSIKMLWNHDKNKCMALLMCKYLHHSPHFISQLTLNKRSK